jgi:hypothetical protein
MLHQSITYRYITDKSIQSLFLYSYTEVHLDKLAQKLVTYPKGIQISVVISV